MTVARETPTFIYRNSLDLTGFIDGTATPSRRTSTTAPSSPKVSQVPADRCASPNAGSTT